MAGALYWQMLPRLITMLVDYRAGAIVLRFEGDVILYALGTGEYDELNCRSSVVLLLYSTVHINSKCHAVAETLRAVSQGLRDTLRKPTESALFSDYGRMCLVVDEVINEVKINTVSVLCKVICT